jgi:glucose-6-phosphate 1-dehydrogenase
VIERLVLFGATGDLAGRFLFPALARLFSGGHLSDGFEVTGTAREELDEEAFRQHVDERLAEHAGDVPVEARETLLRSLRYRAADVAEPASVASLLGDSASAVAAYLALPPKIYPAAVEALSRAGLPAGSRIVLEKPFGESLESAVSLNGLLAEVAGEEAVFRVDHVLGMATAQNLVALRRNRALEPVWNGAHVEQVEVLWEETIALEGRASFYDAAGALKDVVQNHVLQVLCLVALEPPADERDLTRRKIDVLRSARVLSSRRARYSAGDLASGQAVPDYADEDGVDPERGTETFAEVALALDDERWRGTTFVLRAGKALRRRRKQVALRFRDHATELRIGIDGPTDIVLRLGDNALRGEPPTAALPAYANVLLDVLVGGSALSVSADEAEWAWRVVAPVLDDWRTSRVPLEEYAAGSDGPVVTA